MIPDEDGAVGRLDWYGCDVCVHDEDCDASGPEDLYIDRDTETVRCRGYREEES